MLDFLIQKRATLLLILLLSGMIALMASGFHRSERSAAIEEAVARATGPLVKGGSSAVGGLSEGWESVAELRGARDKSRKLEAEVTALRAEKQKWEEERRENERLRLLIGLKPALGAPTIAARFAAASPSEERTVLIDRGLRDGVREGFPVIALSGIVGRIIMAGVDMSKVLLVSDPASGVSVAHQDGRYQGMMVGKAKRMCELLYLSTEAKVVPGDLLVTTGLDGIFPPGLPAGRIISVRRGVMSSLEIEVRPEARPENSEELLVLLSPPGVAGGPRRGGATGSKDGMP